MPMDIIERALAKAAGSADASQLEEIIYEGYGPSGTAILVEAMTDNRNRTVAEIRNLFSKGGGNLGEAGSVAWLFSTRGVISIPTSESLDSDEASLAAIDAGAEDFNIDDDLLSIYTKPEQVESVRQALEGLGYKPSSSEIDKLPATTVSLKEDDAVKTLRLLDRLEDLEDVQKVYSNADFPEEVLASYAG